jgi:hypothetical protein
VAVDVFRPQGAGRAVRTAFVLGALVVIAAVSAVGAFGQFSALVGNNTKDELSRYLDDHAYSRIQPSGAGFRADFPVPPTRQSERVVTTRGVFTVPRDGALVDDEVTFDAYWFDVPGAPPATDPFISSFMALQIRQVAGTKIGASVSHKLGRATWRDFVFVNVDKLGVKRYFDERIIVDGGSVWVLRLGSRIRRDEAFRVFAGTFAFTK